MSDDVLAFRIGTVRAGAWLTTAFAAAYLAYYWLLWDAHAGRALSLAIVFSVPPFSVLLGLFPPVRLLASRWSDAFFLSWSALLALVSWALAALDGGAGSPLIVALFLPLAFASLAYPLPSVLTLGALVIVAYTLLAVLVGGGSLPQVVFVDAALAFEALVCAWQAANHAASSRKIARLWRLDALTGCLNRRGLEEAVAPVAGSGAVSLVLVDLDGFKEVNDAHGHAAGDDLLRVVAERLRACTRPEDLVARMGGDEFAVVLTGASAGSAGACAVAERILAALRLPVVVDEHELLLTGSAGIVHGDAGSDLSELLRDADAAMYRAKDQPGSCWVEFAPEMRADASARLSALADLRAALGTGQLVLHYQPIVDLRSDAVVAAEALVRWERPPRSGDRAAGGRLVAPAEFIGLAEQSGLIVALGREVLERACRQAREWVYTDGAPAAVSVNVSARQLIDPGFVATVEDALRGSGLPARALVLEITETAFLRDPDAAAARLRELRALGVGVALDDFGTGYSSLAYLRDLPVDYLKVARPFVAQMDRGEHDRALLRSIVELGRGLGLTVVAEGIETAAQADALRELSCQLGQGFLLGRPQPAHALVAPLAAGASLAPQNAKRPAPRRRRPAWSSRN